MALDPKLIKYDGSVVVEMPNDKGYKVILPLTIENAGFRGWLIDNIGPMADLDKHNSWKPMSNKMPWTARVHGHTNNPKVTVMFYRKEDAMLFALRWL